METITFEDVIDMFGATIPERCQQCQHALALYAIRGTMEAAEKQKPGDRITEDEMHRLIGESLRRCSDEFGCSESVDS